MSSTDWHFSSPGLVLGWEQNQWMTKDTESHLIYLFLLFLIVYFLSSRVMLEESDVSSGYFDLLP